MMARSALRTTRRRPRMKTVSRRRRSNERQKTTRRPFPSGAWCAPSSAARRVLFLFLSTRAPPRVRPNAALSRRSFESWRDRDRVTARTSRSPRSRVERSRRCWLPARAICGTTRAQSRGSSSSWACLTRAPNSSRARPPPRARRTRRSCARRRTTIRRTLRAKATLWRRCVASDARAFAATRVFGVDARGEGFFYKREPR